jgi:hypothetical protein
MLLVASLAGAAEVQVHATTLVSGVPELVNPTGPALSVLPIYELVGLSVRHLEVRGYDDVALALDGWASVDLDGLGSSGDLNLAYVEGLTLERHLRVRLGRQLLVGGGSRLLAIDGLFAEVKAGYGLGLSAFLGKPVVRRFSNYSHGDFASGGRLFFAPTTDLQAGVSFTHVGDGNAVVRQDVGVDARWNLWRMLTLTGNVLWSVVEGRLAELDLGPRWQPLPELEVAAAWRRTAPDLFLPRTSIFSVFAESQRDDLGGTIQYQVTRALSVLGDGHVLWLNSQTGYDLGLAATVQPGRSTGASLTTQVRRLSVPVNGYTQARVAGRTTLPVGLSVYADVDLYVLDQPIRGVTSSISASVGATHALTPHWLLGATLRLGSSPYYEQLTQGMVKLTYVLPEAHP